MIDQALITVTGGRGGDGSASFRREKYIPFGGPDGGDGGNGGNVIFRVNPQLSTLSDFVRLKSFKAEAGIAGSGKRKHGRNGHDLILEVPQGTEIYNIVEGKQEKVSDLVGKTDEFMIAKGGRGGLGNSNFATSTHQTPHEFTPGQPGQHREIRLNLKLIAQVGVIGLPNIGKSTFISLVTKAHPKIGNYAFTTLEPTLGKVDHKGKSFVIADIPGLIAGASLGKGLGDKFLQHVDRTQVLVHFVAGDSADPELDYKVIQDELGFYNKKLLKYPQLVVVSRSDLIPADDKVMAKFIKKHDALKLTQNDPKTTGPILDKIITLLDRAQA